MTTALFTLFALVCCFPFTSFCAESTDHDLKDLSPRVERALRAPSAAADSRLYKKSPEGLAFSVPWEAPDMVTAKVKFWDGLPHVECKVNDKAVWMVVDTGSQISVLEAETAIKCGVRTIPGSDSHINVVGTDGVESALAGVPQTMAIGAWKWENLPCLVRTHANPGLNAGAFLGRKRLFDLIGMNAIQSMCSYLTMDYPRGQVIFGFRTPYQPQTSAGSAPMQLRGTLPFTTVSDGRNSWETVVDTGSAAAVELNREEAKRLGRLKNAVAIDAEVFGLGKRNQQSASPLMASLLPHFQFGGGQFETVQALVVEDRSKVGSGLLPICRMTLDFQRSRIWVEYSK